MESYKRLYAKKQFVSWLREAAESAGPDEYAALGQFSWRVNRGAPHYGVWEEYPFAYDADDCLLGSPGFIWDEIDLGGENFDEFGDDLSEWEHAPPTYNDLIARNLEPFVILDVAVQHKGLIALGFEIVNKHVVDAYKMAKLPYLNIGSIHEIDAEWVLQQTKRPDRIEIIRRVSSW